MPTTTHLKFLLSVAAAAALTAACSSSGGGGYGTNTSAGTGPAGGSSRPVAAAVAIKVSDNRLVGSNGRTLYYNTVDTARKINCVGACTSIWPPVTGTPHAGTGVAAGDLGTTKRPDGGTQVTFKGHPLYAFSGDTTGDDHKGQGIADGGGKWVVANPAQTDDKGGSSGSDDGSKAPSAPKSSAPGDGGGYTY